jgi:hypothetical protein
MRLPHAAQFVPRAALLVASRFFGSVLTEAADAPVFGF